MDYSLFFGYYINFLYWFLVVILIILPISWGHSKPANLTTMSRSLQTLYHANRLLFISICLVYFAAMTFGGVLWWVAVQNAN